MNDEDRVLLTELKDDIKEMKDWILGNKYHPEGVDVKIKKNSEDIEILRTKQSKFFAFWGGITMFAVIAITSVINFFIYIYNKS